MAGQAIPVDTAGQMITKYFDLMSNLGVNMEEQTQSVSFSGTDLMNWLNNVMGHSDELRVFMGAYSDEDPNAGRTTVILWPYKNGQPAEDAGDNPIDPFNEGTGAP